MGQQSIEERGHGNLLVSITVSALVLMTTPPTDAFGCSLEYGRLSDDRRDELGWTSDKDIG